MFDALRRDGISLKEHSEAVDRLCRDKDLVGWLGNITRYEGKALVLLGYNQEGITQIQQGIADMQSVSVRIHFTGSLGFLAQAQLKDGEPEDALTTLDDALELVDARNERFCGAELYRLRGDVLMEMGNKQGAESSYRCAIQVAQDQKAKSWELLAATDLARLWKDLGKTKHAHDLLSEIYNWFIEGFDTPDLIAAKALLKELT
jgi:predicted ATPase